MSQAAALLVATQRFADDAHTFGATQYYLGMRDAFEAVFRACHGVPDDQDAMTAAAHALAQLSPEEREDLITTSKDTLRTRRAETVKESLSAV